MVKFINFVDNLVDRTLMLVFLVCLLIGVYFVYDSAYVYYNAYAGGVNPFQRSYDESEDILKSLTSDYVAWLRVDDTKIDYPIMQGDDNNKYLNMDPYGEYSLSGSIFLDARNASDFSDSYSLIYGHHMANGFMFGALDDYYDRSFFDNHRTGSLKVGNTLYQITAFAAMKIDASEDGIFSPEGGSGPALEVAKTSSMHYVEPNNDHIIALSTCKDPGSTSRTVVLFTIDEILDEEEDE